MSRLALLRQIHGKAKCDHNDVLIRSILRPYSLRTKSRTIGGRCQICSRDVQREMTAHEIETGVPQSVWRVTP